MLPAAGQFIDKVAPPPAFFRRLSMANKMLLGYAVLVILTVVVAGYALFSLQRINALNESIVTVQVVIQEASDHMMDSLLAMDTYEKRFLVLGSDDMAGLFQKRWIEYQASFQTLLGLAGRGGLDLQNLAGLGTSYTTLFAEEISLVHAGKVRQARALSDGAVKDAVDKLRQALRDQAAAAKATQDASMKDLGSVGRAAFLTSVALCACSIVIGGLAAILVTHYVSSSVSRLTEATNHFAEGDFAFDPHIRTGDEIGHLARAFLAMGERLAKLEELSLDASPLTRLPGGMAVEKALERRIQAGIPLAFCWIDLSNFKAFNDRYGYARGNIVIKETASIVETTVRSAGGPEDFVGHIGGDDFVVITDPAAMRQVAGEIIDRFDRAAPSFYDPEDRARGFIQGTTRKGESTQFPVMTVSIAIVTNERRRLTSFPEVSSIAAELKGTAKMDPRSVYVIDRRGQA